MPNIFNTLDRESSPRIDMRFAGSTSGSSITLTFPEMIEIFWFSFTLSASAVAGTRVLRFLIEEITGQNIFDTRSGETMTAGQSRTIIFTHGIRDTSYVSNRAYQPIPQRLFVAPDQQLIVNDTNFIDPGGDTFAYGMNFRLVS